MRERRTAIVEPNLHQNGEEDDKKFLRAVKEEWRCAGLVLAIERLGDCDNVRLVACCRAEENRDLDVFKLFCDT